MWKVLLLVLGVGLSLGSCADSPEPPTQVYRGDTTGGDSWGLVQDVGMMDVTDVTEPRDGASDEPDTSCIPNPKFIDRVETACTGVNGKAIWKFDPISCTWSFGSYPDAKPMLTYGVTNVDLQWMRNYYGCQPPD